MSLMGLVAAGQQGLLIQAVAGFIGIEEDVARVALERLVGGIARQLAERAAADPVEGRILMDVIVGGDFQRYFDDPRLLFGRDAVRDGEGALAYLYGSVEAARAQARTLGSPAGLDREVFARLMTLAASLVLAAIARRFEQQARREVPPDGILKQVSQLILRAVVDGTSRTVFRRRPTFHRRMAISRRKVNRQRPDDASPAALLGDLLDEKAPR